MKLLTLGLILDSPFQPKPTLELIHWLEENPHIEVRKFFLNTDINKKNFLRRNIWNIIIYIEKLFFSYYFELFSDTSLDLRKYTFLEPLVINSDNFEKTDEYRIIKSKEIDLFFKLNFDEEIENLCKLSRHGLLSIYARLPSKKLNKSPNAFNEVLMKSNKTGFSLIHQKELNADIGIVFQGAFPTHNYFFANKMNLMKRRNIYIQNHLSFFIKNKFFKNYYTDHSYSFSKLEVAPLLSEQIRYSISISYRLFKKILKKFFFHQSHWSVGLYFSNWKNFKFNEANIIQNPKDCFLADPFIFSFAGRDYCFLEEYSFKKSIGTIVVYEISPDKVSRVGCAINESFHMSFPFIFEFEGGIYMLPETSANNDIRIYKATEFPIKWELKKILMKDVFAVDSMIFFHNGLWWLFSNINPDHGTDACSDLKIFFAKHPFSEVWIEHPLNPLIVDSELARNAGIIIDKNEIFRVSQKQTFDMYGGEFQINKINLLDTENYSESLIYSFSPRQIRNSKAAHHFHGKGEITAFDFLK